MPAGELTSAGRACFGMAPERWTVGIAAVLILAWLQKVGLWVLRAECMHVRLACAHPVWFFCTNLCVFGLHLGAALTGKLVGPLLVGVGVGVLWQRQTEHWRARFVGRRCMCLSAEDINSILAFPAFCFGECNVVSLCSVPQIPALLCTYLSMPLLHSSSSSVFAASSVWDIKEPACTFVAGDPDCFSPHGPFRMCRLQYLLQ